MGYSAYASKQKVKLRNHHGPNVDNHEEVEVTVLGTDQHKKFSPGARKGIALATCRGIAELTFHPPGQQSGHSLLLPRASLISVIDDASHAITVWDGDNRFQTERTISGVKGLPDEVFVDVFTSELKRRFKQQCHGFSVSSKIAG